MKITWPLILVLIVSGLFHSAIQAQSVRITIVYTNDSHSYLTPSGRRDDGLQSSIGGISRAATIIKKIQSSEKNVVTLHAGDYSIGDMTYNVYRGVPELRLLKSLGFDALALGNHEFDLGSSKLQTILDSAFAGGKIPILSANAIMKDSAAGLKQYITAHTIKQFGIIKVGIFGMTTPETNVYSDPQPVVIDENMLVIAQEQVTSLVSSGCSIVIMLSHLGMKVDRIMAQTISGINLIVGAHDHLLTTTPVELKNPIGQTTYIVQEDGFYQHIGKFQFDVGLTGIKYAGNQNIEINSTVQEDAQTKNTVDAIITDIESKLGPVYTQKIGEASDDFEEVGNLNVKGNMDTPIGNLVTDAFRAKTNTDLAIDVGSLTSHKLFKGPLTRSDIFRVLGYGFNNYDGLGYRIATFKIDGTSLWLAIEGFLGLTDLLGESMLPQVSGMQYFCNLNNIPGNRLTSVKVAGQDLDLQKTYTITSNEYLVSLLHKISGVTFSDLNILNDVTEYISLLEYVKANSPVSPVSSGRVTDIKNSISDFKPLCFKLEQNYPNPFNPATTINYTLAKEGNIKITVYDAIGREAAIIVNEYKLAGSYSVRLNAANMPSGIYFYRLQTGSFVETRKMLLLK